MSLTIEIFGEQDWKNVPKNALGTWTLMAGKLGCFQELPVGGNIGSEHIIQSDYKKFLCGMVIHVYR